MRNAEDLAARGAEVAHLWPGEGRETGGTRVGHWSGGVEDRILERQIIGEGMGEIAVPVAEEKEVLAGEGN